MNNSYVFMGSKSSFVFLFLAFVLAFSTILIHKKFPTKELKDRVMSWWYIFAFFFIALISSKTTSMFLFGFLSFLALKEYFSLIPSRQIDRRIMFYAYLSIIFQYYFVGTAWFVMFLIWIPIYTFLFLPFRQVISGITDGFLENTAKVQWGVMLFVLGLSHLAYLANLEPINNSGASGIEIILYLLILTVFNDVLQYIWGKSFGKRKISPKVSPNKTVEGFLGAFVSISFLALVFSFLTPFNWYQAIFAGMLISCSGFIGDVVISMLKRDVGVKDSGSFIPGHGGVLDRIDSLTYSAPLFFHYIYYLYY